jgi:hypothetical protein
MKIVINDCYGGFGLSKIALESYAHRKGIKLGSWNQTWGFFSEFQDRDIPRNDSDLISIVEDLGQLANGSSADLRVIEIPDDVEWQIEEYDGSEWVAEKHRTWR